MDSPYANGIPCNDYTIVIHDHEEEELQDEARAKLEIDTADVSVVLDDTMCKGVEPWGWHGIRPINEKLIQGGALVVISKRDHSDLLRFIGAKPFEWRLGIIEGEASLAGLWVNKDDFTHERSLGAIAGVDPEVIEIEAVEAYLKAKHPKDPRRAHAARQAHDEVLAKTRTAAANQAIDWKHPVTVLRKCSEVREDGARPPVS